MPYYLALAQFLPGTFLTDVEGKPVFTVPATPSLAVYEFLDISYKAYEFNILST